MYSSLYRISIFLFATVSLFLCTHCGKQENTLPNIPGNRILAEYGDHQITVRDAMIAFQERFAFDRLIAPDSVAYASEVVNGLIDTYAYESFLAEKAIELDLDQKPAFQEYRENVIRDELHQKVLLEDVLKPLRVTEEEIKNFYEENRETLFMKKHTHVYVARGIYTIFDSKNRDKAHQKIQEAFKQLQQGQPFESVALNYSEAEPLKRGKPTTIPIREADHAITSQLANVKDGEYTEIFEHNNHFYILYREEHRPADYVPVNLARPAILQQLTQQKIERELVLLYERLRQQRTVLVQPELVAKADVLEPSVVILTVPGVYEATLGDFMEVTKNKKSVEEKIGVLNELTQKAVYLAEAIARGWDEDKVAPAVNFWCTRRLAEEFIRSQLGQITDEKIRSTYEENKNTPDFFTPQIYELSHIFFKVPSLVSMTQYEQLVHYQQAMQKAEAAMNEIRQGRPFEEVVALYSHDPMAANTSGYIGRLTLDDLEPSIQNIVKKLKAGQISEPQKVSNLSKDRYGYEIFYIKNIEPPKPLSYEEARDLIGKYYAIMQYNQKNDEYLEQFLAEHPKKLHLDVMDEVIDYLLKLSKRPDRQVDIAKYEEPR